MIMKKALITAGLIFALNPLMSYALAPVEDYSEPANEIQDGGVSLSRTIERESRQGTLTERLQRLESKVEHLTESNVTSRIEELQQTIQELRGELEKQSHDLEQLNNNQKNFYKDLNNRIAKTKEAPQAMQTEDEVPPEAAPVKSKVATEDDAISLSTPTKSRAKTVAEVAPVSPPVKVKAKSVASSVVEARNAIPLTKPASNPVLPATQAKAAPVETAAVSGDAETALYQQGFALLKTKQYDRALGQFREYTKQYPRGRYAVNAHFWTGEINYLQGKHAIAKKSFETVVNNYPKDSKIPDAMLKLAIIATDTGHKQKAEELLQTIQKKYPGTTAARLAMIRSQELRLSVH